MRQILYRRTLKLMRSYVIGLRIPPPLDRRPSMLRAHEYRRVALPVVQQPAGILHEALRVALVPAHCLGAEELGLGKELDSQFMLYV